MDKINAAAADLTSWLINMSPGELEKILSPMLEVSYRIIISTSNDFIFLLSNKVYKINMSS